ncbi:MAG TPA: IPTL-CTERM sorting domain-containing protein, partial [Thermoanaerobaculia bacterium]
MHVQKSGLARIAFVFVLLTLGLVPAASAATSQFQILLNLDNNQNTGCDVPTLTGTFDGVEQILTTTVDTIGSSAAQVTALQIQNCTNPASNTFGPPSAVAAPPGRPLPWPVGVSNGTDGSSVIETYYPLSLSTVQHIPVIRLGVLGLANSTVEDEMLTARVTPGQGPPILIQALGVPDIPTLSEWALILLGLALFAAAMMTLRRRTATAFLVALLLLGLAGAAWAIAGDLDGNTIDEWGAPLATETFAEAGADAPAGTDIRALFGYRCSVLNAICFRIDAVLQYSGAINDTTTVAEDSGATTINVLANDIGGPFTIQSVTQPANGTVAITNAGADLTYTPNANYCNAPPGTTPDTFTYTVTPGGFTATVSVTVTCVDDPPTAVNDSATVPEDAPATAVPVLANDTDIDAGPISITAVTQPANGAVVITGGGTGLTYQPNANYCNTPPGTTLDTFTYTLNGGSSATVTMTVTCFDNPPVAVADTATIIEDSGATTINVLANDTDIDGGPISIASVTQPTNGTVTNNGTDLTYAPNANYCNNPPGTTLDTFTYTLTPGSSSTTVTVTVTCVNDDPVAVADAATVAEDSGATAVDVLANDSDVENDPFTIGSVVQPTNGTVVITGGGTGLTYQPDADFCGTDTFTYTLTPGSSTATVTMTVTCSDDPPVAVDDSATVAEDSGANAINVLANDTDPDGGPISITSVTQPANGTVVITGGGTGLTYQPNANYCNNPPGTTLETFTYTLTPASATPTATVTVTVTCDDDPPTAVADSATVMEDSGASTINVLANDTDPDGGPISITSVTQPTNGTVVITNGGADLTYAPNANYCNSVSGVPDTFTYTLTPGGSSTTVTVTVTCVDDDPTAVADAATVNEDSGANAIDVLANDTDPDGGAISVTSVTQGANGSVAITGGGTGVTYTPNPNYCGADSFTYTLTPGGSSATVTVTVTCVDDFPAAVADAATVNEDSGANTINVLANDIDVDAGPISITAVTQGTNGSVAITNGGADLTYTPNADYCGADSFTYTLTPGGSTATVTVTVTCLNDGPVIDLDADDDKGTGGSDFATTYTEGNPATLIEDPVDATVTDVDNTTLASLTVTLTNLLDTGNETLATDVTGTSIVANYAVAPGTGTLTLTGPDTLANFQTVLRKVTYLNTSNAPNSTPRVINFVANDGTTNGNTAVSTVTVVSVDTNPTAVNDAATVNEDSGANPIDVLANDTDPDGGTKSVTSVTQGANGSVAITGGGTGVTYTPNANFCGSDSFTYTLTPGGSTATVSVTVTCVDDNPVAVNDAATVAEDSGATAIPVLANDTDADGGPISITSVTQGANGTVVITGGGTGLTYQPNANYCGSDSFTYTLTPGGSTATVSVTVTCVDDNPVAVADAATVIEDSSNNAINVLANDTDVDGGAISITSVTQPTNGAVVITGGGTGVSYTPNPNYCNAPPGTTLDTFTYTLTPGGSSTTVTVTVTCVDDPPVAVADSATVTEDAPATAIPVLANDTDPDGGPISITSVTQPANGTVVITGGGTGLTYQPNANYCNSLSGPLDTFTYTLTPASATPTATVTMTVTCVNDPPVADPDMFDFIGNTDLVVDQAALATPHALETTPSTFGVVDGDSDPVENNAISVTSITVGICVDSSAPLDCSDPAVGRVQMQSNGRFIFTPAPGDAGATETFQYTLTDDGLPAPASAIGTVTLTRFERVWYVKNDAPAGGNGTSASPFNSITAANLSDNFGDGDLTDDLDSAGDYIFVYFGTGTTANQAGGLVLENNQHLIGQHAGLSLNVNLNGNGAPTNLVTAVAGNRPLLDDTVVDAFEGVAARDVIPAEITGMSLAGNVNGIDWTTTAAFAGTGEFIIRDNVIRSATNEGVDINLAGTGATRLAFHDNNLTATGTGLDIQETGTGALTITAFDDNVVSGNTGGSGIFISNAIFDSVPGGTLDAVNGGTTVIGAPGNPAGTNLNNGGLWMDPVSGSLTFTDLDIYAAGFGLAVVGTGPFTGATGMSIQVTPAPPDNTGTSTMVANDGAAVAISNATVDLRLAGLTSTPTTFSTSGVDFANVAGQFRAPTGSSINKTSGPGTAFRIDNSTAGTTVLTSVYDGTISNTSGTARSVLINNADSGSSASFSGSVTDTGQGVSLTNNTGATVSFSGGLSLSTGANAGFAATGGGTISVCDENPCNGAATGGLVNTITTTTGTALNVANTTISSNNLEFRSISANGASNGIILNSTGSNGSLMVKGNGGSCTSAATCTGGAIQATTGDG